MRWTWWCVLRVAQLGGVDLVVCTEGGPARCEGFGGVY